MCMVREWDLSYECLESRKARQALRELKETDPEFYHNELMAGKHVSLLPGQGEVLDEDNEVGGENEEGDDCYLSISQIVEAVVKGSDVMGLTNSESEMMVHWFKLLNPLAWQKTQMKLNWRGSWNSQRH